MVIYSVYLFSTQDFSILANKAYSSKVDGKADSDLTRDFISAVNQLSVQMGEGKIGDIRLGNRIFLTEKVDPYICAVVLYKENEKDLEKKAEKDMRKKAERVLNDFKKYYGEKSGKLGLEDLKTFIGEYVDPHF